MSRIRNLLTGCVGIAALGAGTAGAQEYELTLHHLLGPTSPAHTQMLQPWADAIEEGTDGRVHIEIYPAMSLGGTPPQLVRQVRDGVVDIVWTVNGYTPGLFPRTEVFELPFVHTNDPRATNLAMYDLFDEWLAEEYEGMEVMFLHVHQGQAIHMADSEVRVPADIDGLTMRIPTRTGAWVLEALGAAAVSMPVPDLPQSLARGVVDGALIPFEIIPALQLQDLTEYQIEGPDSLRFGTTTFQVSMNQDTWDGLPEDIQQVFREVSGPEWWGEVGDIWAATDEGGLQVAIDAGNTHVVLTEEEIEEYREVLEPVVQQWIDEVTASGIDGAGLVEAARAAIASHGG